MSAIEKAMRERGWHKRPDQSLRRRAWMIARRGGPWYDWGAKVMLLTAQVRHGDYQAPRGRDLWYLPDSLRGGALAPITTYDYESVRAYPEGEWKVLDLQDQGGSLVLGWWPRPDGVGSQQIARSDLDQAEIALLRRWLLWECFIRAEWLGIRPRLYWAALHAHVHARKPFACNQTPPRNSGGYDHWYCTERPHHTGDHRYRNYTWPRTAGPVAYNPEEAVR